MACVAATQESDRLPLYHLVNEVISLLQQVNTPSFPPIDTD